MRTWLCTSKPLQLAWGGNTFLVFSRMRCMGTPHGNCPKQPQSGQAALNADTNAVEYGLKRMEIFMKN